MNDRRRVNGPGSGSQSAVLTFRNDGLNQIQRTRKVNELRKIFLQTGLVPAANGSAYLELETSPPTSQIARSPTIKLSCTVHGPKPLSRSAHFSPNLQLSASIKFAPFATHQRRGYVRDNIERDLGSHLENALHAAIIPDRWPKSALEVAVTVLEAEGAELWDEESSEKRGLDALGLMNVLASSITVASAALADAKIDCLDLLTGGVAAVVPTSLSILLDPCLSEHDEVSSACVVAYMPSRDEIAEIWSKNSGKYSQLVDFEKLLDSAVKAAQGAHSVLTRVAQESTKSRSKQSATKVNASTQDVEMKT